MLGATRSLRSWLVGGIFALCVAPVLVIGIYTAVGVGEFARREARADLQDKATQIAMRLDSGMHERWRDVALAASTLRGGMSSDQEEVRDLLDSLQAAAPIYAWIGIADTAGRVTAATKGLLEGNDVSSRPWFRAGMQAPFAGDVHEALLLAKALPPLPNGDPLRFVDIAMPLSRAGGVPAGVLGAHLSWSWADEVAASVHVSESGGEALVVSREGTVLMGPEGLRGETLDFPAIRAGRQGVVRTGMEAWPDGHTYFTSVVPTRGEGEYPGLGWLVIVRRDADHALAEASAFQRQIAIVGAGTALLVCVAGWTLAGRLTRPLGGLAEQALRLSRGDLSVPVAPTRAFTEAAVLSASLNELAARLAALQETGRGREPPIGPPAGPPPPESAPG